MTCNFNPPLATLNPNESATTSLTFASPAAAKAGMLSLTGLPGWLALPLSLLSLRRIRKRSCRVPALGLLVLLSAVSFTGMIGCSSGGGSNGFQEAGPKTVLVTVSTGTVTSVVPVVLSIQ